jgi:hypothetical protein
MDPTKQAAATIKIASGAIAHFRGIAFGSGDFVNHVKTPARAAVSIVTTHLLQSLRSLMASICCFL